MNYSVNFFKKHLKPISIVLLFLILVTYIKIWVNMDESYTLDLIHNDYKMIIVKDTLDMHPPLYYLLLKLFFQVTLFWKHSIIAEIVMGRVFSIACSFLTANYLIKINSKLGITINKYIAYIGFFMLPIVLFAENLNLSPAIDIRMYALSGLFVTLVCYYLICYLDNYRVKNIVFMTIYSIMAEYTHYYAAVTVGLILFFMCVFCLYKKEYKSMLTFLMSGILFFIFYLPWLVYAVPKQFSILNYGQPLFKDLFGVGLAIAIMIIFVGFLAIIRQYICSKVKKYILLLVSINSVILVVAAIYSVLKSPVFLFRYIYPSLLPLFFLSISIILFNIFNKKIKIKCSLFLLALILIGSLGSYLNEIIKVVPISISVWKNDKYFGSYRSRYVSIDEMKYDIMKYDVNNSYMSDKVQLGIYLKSIGKVPYVTTRKDAKYNNNYAPNKHTMHKFVYYRK